MTRFSIQVSNNLFITNIAASLFSFISFQSTHGNIARNFPFSTQLKISHFELQFENGFYYLLMLCDLNVICFLV